MTTERGAALDRRRLARLWEQLEALRITMAAPLPPMAKLQWADRELPEISDELRAILDGQPSALPTEED